jgi:hypothetical protein
MQNARSSARLSRFAFILVPAFVFIGLAGSAPALAQVPVPSASTPTLHGGTPVTGNVVSGEVGYAAVRTSLYFGLGSDVDVGIQLAAPTFGHSALPGWNQDVGMDVRAPFRFRISQWARATGSLKVAPLFHVGRGCFWNYRGNCGLRALGTGVVIGYVTDIALPKLFKLIVGIEQQMGVLHWRNTNNDNTANRFAGATWLDLGLSAFWGQQLFFTLIMNMGAQYGSDELHYRDHALFRQLFGVGYKWR